MELETWSERWNERLGVRDGMRDWRAKYGMRDLE